MKEIADVTGEGTVKDLHNHIAVVMSSNTEM